MSNKVIGALPYSLSLKVVNPGDAESEKKIGATLQERECITLSMLAQHMADHGTPFSKGVIQGVLVDMVECTKELLKAGYGVDLTGLAKFSLHASSKLVDSVQEFNPATDIKRINIRASVEKAATAFMNTDVDYEYVMTREEQAKAKKAAKAALPQAPEDDNNSGGGSSGSGGDPGVTE